MKRRIWFRQRGNKVTCMWGQRERTRSKPSCLGGRWWVEVAEDCGDRPPTHPKKRTEETTEGYWQTDTGAVSGKPHGLLVGPEMATCWASRCASGGRSASSRGTGRLGAAFRGGPPRSSPPQMCRVDVREGRWGMAVRWRWCVPSSQKKCPSPFFHEISCISPPEKNDEKKRSLAGRRPVVEVLEQPLRRKAVSGVCHRQKMACPCTAMGDA